VELGKELLERELGRLRRELPAADQLERAAQRLGHPAFEQVYAALGRGDLGPAAVLRELFPEDGEVTEARPPTALERIAEKIRRTGRGVRIQGLENLMVRYSQCCQPVPGDKVIGYITSGRGVSIHRADCPNVLTLADHPDRRVEIQWAAVSEDRFFVRLSLEGTDRRGLLSDIAQAITDTGTDIQHADIHAKEGGMTGEFVVEVQDLTHLQKVMKAMRRVKGILSVERRESFAEADLTEA